VLWAFVGLCSCCITFVVIAFGLYLFGKGQKVLGCGLILGVLAFSCFLSVVLTLLT